MTVAVMALILVMMVERRRVHRYHHSLLGVALLLIPPLLLLLLELMRCQVAVAAEEEAAMVGIVQIAGTAMTVERAAETETKTEPVIGTWTVLLSATSPAAASATEPE
jgi:inner membrane protein involved in colicin E2 resistance